MENIRATGEDRDKMRLEFLARMDRLENENWDILGWRHMHLGKIKWLKNPEKLAQCIYYKILKNWLVDGIVISQQSDDGSVDSIYFILWLAKGEEICMAGYAEHRFNDAESEIKLDRIEYSITFWNWEKIFLAFVNK